MSDMKKSFQTHLINTKIKTNNDQYTNNNKAAPPIIPGRSHYHTDNYNLHSIPFDIFLSILNYIPITEWPKLRYVNTYWYDHIQRMGQEMRHVDLTNIQFMKSNNKKINHDHETGENSFNFNTENDDHERGSNFDSPNKFQNSEIDSQEKKKQLRMILSLFPLVEHIFLNHSLALSLLSHCFSSRTSPFTRCRITNLRTISIVNSIWKHQNEVIQYLPSSVRKVQFIGCQIKSRPIISRSSLQYLECVEFDFCRLSNDPPSLLLSNENEPALPNISCIAHDNLVAPHDEWDSSQTDYLIRASKYLAEKAPKLPLNINLCLFEDSLPGIVCFQGEDEKMVPLMRWLFQEQRCPIRSYYISDMTKDKSLNHRLALLLRIAAQRNTMNRIRDQAESILSTAMENNNWEMVNFIYYYCKIDINLSSIDNDLPLWLQYSRKLDHHALKSLVSNFPPINLAYENSRIVVDKIIQNDQQSLDYLKTLDGTQVDFQSATDLSSNATIYNRFPDRALKNIVSYCSISEEELFRKIIDITRYDPTRHNLLGFALQMLNVDQALTSRMDDGRLVAWHIPQFEPLLHMLKLKLRNCSESVLSTVFNSREQPLQQIMEQNIVCRSFLELAFRYDAESFHGDQDPNHNNVLHHMFMRGKILLALKLLTSESGQIWAFSWLSERNNNGDSPLHVLRYSHDQIRFANEICSHILKNNISILNMTDSKGRSCLVRMIMNDCHSIVFNIIQMVHHNLSELWKDPFYEGFIYSLSNLPLVKHLEASLPLSESNRITLNGKSLLHYAAEHDRVEFILSMFRKRNLTYNINVLDSDNNRTPLHYAAMTHNVTSSVLLDEGSDPIGCVDNNNQTPFDVAPLSVRIFFILYLENNIPEQIWRQMQFENVWNDCSLETLKYSVPKLLLKSFELSRWDFMKSKFRISLKNLEIREKNESQEKYHDNEKFNNLNNVNINNNNNNINSNTNNNNNLELTPPLTLLQIAIRFSSTNITLSFFDKLYQKVKNLNNIFNSNNNNNNYNNNNNLSNNNNNSNMEENKKDFENLKDLIQSQISEDQYISWNWIFRDLFRSSNNYQWHSIVIKEMWHLGLDFSRLTESTTLSSLTKNTNQDLNEMNSNKNLNHNNMNNNTLLHEAAIFLKKEDHDEMSEDVVYGSHLCELVKVGVPLLFKNNDNETVSSILSQRNLFMCLCHVQNSKSQKYRKRKIYSLINNNHHNNDSNPSKMEKKRKLCDFQKMKNFNEKNTDDCERITLIPNKKRQRN